MTTIKSNPDYKTAFFIFTVKPENADKLIEVLRDGAANNMSTFQGFISVNIHKSEDGTKVINYAQWQSKESMLPMNDDPVSKIRVGKVRELAESVQGVWCDKIWVVDEQKWKK